MDSSMSGKVAVISGGGGGIGHAAALAFAAAGARVAVIELDPARARRTATAVTEAGGEAVAIAADITNDAQVAEAMRGVIGRFGRLDILHNCAGVTVPEDGPVREVPLEVFDRTFDLDVRGTFLCCRHAIPAMIRAGGGAIVNMSSGAARARSTCTPRRKGRSCPSPVRSPAPTRSTEFAPMSSPRAG